MIGSSQRSCVTSRDDFISTIWQSERPHTSHGSEHAEDLAVTVTIGQAIKVASEELPGKGVEAELEKKHDKLVWEVEVVTAKNKVIEVHIEAGTGAVVDVEEEKSDQDIQREHKGRDQP